MSPKSLATQSLSVLLLAGLGVAPHASFAQDEDPPQDAPRQERDALGQALVKGLMAAEGCLGVETARSSTGKNVIFAWFADKEATIDWYWSDTHQEAMDVLAAGGSASFEPLEHVADDVGPVLCIASITPAKKAAVEGVAMPISQIAIELYTPLPGGIAVGGSFSPEKMKVPHLQRIPLPQGGRPPVDDGED